LLKKIIQLLLIFCDHENCLLTSLHLRLPATGDDRQVKAL
jgi:hypothetical protein